MTMNEIDTQNNRANQVTSDMAKLMNEKPEMVAVLLAKQAEVDGPAFRQFTRKLIAKHLPNSFTARWARQELTGMR